MTTENETNTESLENEPESFVGESIEETILGAIEELSTEKPNEPKADENVQGDESPEVEKPAAESDLTKAARTLAQGKKRSKQVVEAKDLDAEPKEAAAVAPEVPTKLEPPQRWDVPSKEEFNKLPPVAKKQILDFWGGIESHTTKLWQDLNREKSSFETRTGEFDRLADHYKQYWHSSGRTGLQVTAQLWHKHEELVKDPLGAADKLLAEIGVTPEQIYQRRQGGAAPISSPQPQQSQQNYLTRDELPVLWNEMHQHQQGQQMLDSAVSEVAQLRNEVDNEGRYRYPELWNDQHIERLKPLVEDIRKTQPTLSWAEATKQGINAIRYLEGRLGSPSPSDQRLPRVNNDIERARTAAVSVRGRGNPQVSTVGKAKPGETIQETLDAVYAALAQNY